MIGPIFSNKVKIITRNANRYNINVISLSNNQELYNKTNDEAAIFLAGFLPEQKIISSIEYLQSKNINNYAILTPNTSYGFKVSKIVKDIIKNRDDNLIQSDFYNNSNSSIRDTVKRIIRTYKVPTEKTEGGGRIFEKDYRLLQSDKQYVEAIFFAGSKEDFNSLTSNISELNKEQREIHIVSLNDIDLTKVSSQSNGPVKVILASTDDYNFNRFAKSYNRLFRSNPPRISSIVYDKVSAIAEIVDRNSNKTPAKDDFVNYSPTENVIGFSGVDGRFRFLDNGLIERKYSIFGSKNNRLAKLYDAANDPKFLEYK